MLKQSTAFSFLHHQREVKKGHKLLLLKDHIWELKGIGKKGHLCKLLEENEITTVEKFLIKFYVAREKLQQIFEESKSGRKWNDTINHALTCELDETRHLYFSSLEQKYGVVFNGVGKLVGLCQQGRYVPVEEISASDKDLGHKLVVSVFEHQNNVKKFHDHCSLIHYLSSSRYATIPSEPVKVESSNGWNSHTNVIYENLGAGFSTISQVAISQSHYLANASTFNDCSLQTIESSYQFCSQSLCFPCNFPPSPGYLLEYQGYQNWDTEDNQNDDRYDPEPNAATNVQSCRVSSRGKARKWWKKVTLVLKLLFHKKKFFSSEDAPVAKRRKLC